MEKSQNPTTEHSVYCDHYDVKGTVSLHRAGDKTKVNLQLESLNGDDEISVSLFRDDARLLGKALVSLSKISDER